jgi:ketosteroid isomerase-like protein
MSTVETTTFDLHDLREHVAAGDTDAFGAMLADDVEWTVIDERTRPAAPAVLHGREAIVAMIRGARERGIVTHVSDGFVAGDRAALRLVCTYPTGGLVVENALVEIRDGRIVRWNGVQAWDE